MKPSEFGHVDLRPAAIKRTYYYTSGKVVKYYENIRFVYEIESRVRELKRVTAPAESNPTEQKKERKTTTPVDNQNKTGTQLQPGREPASAGFAP